MQARLVEVSGAGGYEEISPLILTYDCALETTGVSPDSNLSPKPTY